MYSPCGCRESNSIERLNNNNPYSCLGNPMDRGAWRATLHGVGSVSQNSATKLPLNHHHIHTHTYTYIHTDRQTDIYISHSRHAYPLAISTLLAFCSCVICSEHRMSLLKIPMNCLFKCMQFDLSKWYEKGQREITGVGN